MSKDNITILCNVPEQVREASALMFNGGESVTSLNDGSKAHDTNVYRINFTNGKLTRITKILGSFNKDWEWLAFSPKLMWIGDTGNNSGTRSLFTIYRSQNSGKTPDTELKSEAINFIYPNNAKLNCEAAIYFNNKLYLFSKARVTKLFTVPDSTGQFTATFISESVFGFVITDACITDDGKQIYLLSYNRVVLLENWEGENFFSGTKKIFNIIAGQWEGISYPYIISETKSGSPGQIAKLNF